MTEGDLFNAANIEDNFDRFHVNVCFLILVYFCCKTCVTFSLNEYDHKILTFILFIFQLTCLINYFGTINEEQFKRRFALMKTGRNSLQ